MGFDDPIVIILIVALVIFLFGSGQIPKFARSLGQARRAFQEGLTQPLVKQEEEEKKES
jgi:TatA/E family protein of Tat protein translocase